MRVYMLRYMYKRAVGATPAPIIVVMFIFFFVHLIPGNLVRQVAGPQVTKEDVEPVREQLGLNKPPPQQYVSYMTGLVRGDPGTSLRTKRPVPTEVQGRYMNTMQLTPLNLTWGMITRVLIGVWSGRDRSKWQDYTGMTVVISGISIPSFWIGFTLIMVSAIKYRPLPTTGVGSFENLILPPIMLRVSITAIIARFTCSLVIEIMEEDYVRTARTKGLREKTVIWKHMFRNRMISVATVVGLQFGPLLSGSVVTETVSAFPGPDSLLIESVDYRDYLIIQSLILIFPPHSVLINLVVDVLYAVLNPEIQLS